MSESGRTIHSHPPSHPPSSPLPLVNQRARTDVWVEENLDRIEVVSPVMQRQEYAPSEASSVKGANPLEKAFYSLIKATAKLRMSPKTKGEKQIVLEIKRMTEASKTLKERAETENMSEHMVKTWNTLAPYGWIASQRKNAKPGKTLS